MNRSSASTAWPWRNSRWKTNAWSLSPAPRTSSRSRAPWRRWHGWHRNGSRNICRATPKKGIAMKATDRARRGKQKRGDLRQCLRDLARPLRKPADLDPLMERIGDARYVLLGEASHGTAEYYSWRTALSQRLIREKQFS